MTEMTIKQTTIYDLWHEILSLFVISTSRRTNIEHIHQFSQLQRKHGSAEGDTKVIDAAKRAQNKIKSLRHWPRVPRNRFWPPLMATAGFKRCWWATPSLDHHILAETGFYRCWQELIGRIWHSDVVDVGRQRDLCVNICEYIRTEKLTSRHL